MLCLKLKMECHWSVKLCTRTLGTEKKNILKEVLQNSQFTFWQNNITLLKNFETSITLVLIVRKPVTDRTTINNIASSDLYILRSCLVVALGYTEVLTVSSESVVCLWNIT
jgi:hypothetical protein